MNNKPYILVVDDEPDIRELIKDILEDEGYEVSTAENAETAMQSRRQRRPDLALLDIWMPDTDGIAVLRAWADDDDPLFPVVMMSGHASVETAVEATRLGAYDYIEKPLTTANLLLTLQNALKTSQLTQENRRLKQQASPQMPPVGSSATMQALKDRIRKIALHNAWVLIHGEAGVGKEIFAHYLHDHSARKDGPFIEVRAAALIKENSVAELFGSEEHGKIHGGLLEQANGGTLLIDEISDMDLNTQARLYSALETKTFHRLGGIEPVRFDVYIIATTHKDLAQAVKEGTFRDDLYYQLNVVPLVIPPLREHPEDIAELFRHYVQYFSNKDNLPARQLSISAQNHLRHYAWPGNVRELRNLVQRLLILGTEVEVSAAEMGLMMGIKPLPSNASVPALPSASEPMPSHTPLPFALEQPLRQAREAFERHYFNHHLSNNGGNIVELAELSGMERTHLYRKLKTLGIDIKTAKKRS